MRRLERLLPVALLAGAWVLLDTLPLASTAGVPLERMYGWTIVTLFSATLAVEAWRAAHPQLRPLLATGRGRLRFGGLAGAYVLLHALLAGMIRLGDRAALIGEARMGFGYAHGPLTAWPHLEFAWPALGITGFVTLGRVLLMAALAVVFASAACLAWASWRRKRRARCAAAGGGALSGALVSAACPGCAPLLASGLLLLGGATASSLAHRLSDPTATVSAFLEVIGPLVALATVWHLASSNAEEPPNLGRQGPDLRHATRFLPRSVPLLSIGLPFLTAPLLAGLLAAWAPPWGASDKQHLIYRLYLWTSAGALFLTLLVLALLVVFIFRYRYREDEVPEEPRLDRKTKRTLQALYILVPAVIIFSLGLLSFDTLAEMESQPEATVHVEVSAVRFAWHFRYPDGSTSLNELRIQEDEVVVLNVSSADVIHSFYVPDLGVKIDANPGGLNQYWFRPLEPGTYEAFCTEFCGVGHADMDADVIVFPKGTQERPYG